MSLFSHIYSLLNSKLPVELSLEVFAKFTMAQVYNLGASPDQLTLVFKRISFQNVGATDCYSLVSDKKISKNQSAKLFFLSDPVFFTALLDSHQQELLIHLGSNINEKEGVSCCNLLYLVFFNRLDLLKIVYERTCCFNSFKFILDFAAQTGILEIIKFLTLKGAECTKNAMEFAAMNGHVDVVKWLFENRSEGCLLGVTLAIGQGRLRPVANGPNFVVYSGIE